MNQENYHLQLQRLFDFSNQILQTAEINEQAANRAVQKLDKIAAEVGQHLVDIQRETASAVSGIAKTAAGQIATTLLQNFEAANAAAKQAEENYRRAGKSFTAKFFLSMILIMVVAMGFTSFTVLWLADYRHEQYEEQIRYLHSRVELLEKIAVQESSKQSKTQQPRAR